MPQYFTNEGDLEGDEIETLDESTDSQEEEDTSLASQNEESDSDSSPKNSTDDEMDQKLKNTLRRERALGTVSARLTEKLLSRAESGDTEALEDIKDDPEIMRYINSRGKYKSRLESLESDDFRETDKIRKVLREEEKTRAIEGEIRNLGIKGEANYERIKKLANSLFTETNNPKRAVESAYYTLYGDRKSHPVLPRSKSYSNDSEDYEDSIEAVRVFGLNPKKEDFEKAKKLGLI